MLLRTRLAVAAAFAVNTIITSLSTTGLFGQTNAVLSRKYQSLVTPAPYAFAIWGLIFSTQALFVLALFLPWPKLDSMAAFPDAAGWWFVSACVCQAAWSVIFSKELIILSQVVITGILVSLALCNRVLARAHATPRTTSCGDTPTLCGVRLDSRKLLYAGRLPFLIHYGWLSAASLVGLNVVLVSRAPDAHAVLLAAAICTLALVFLAALVNPTTAPSGADPAYSATVSWALIGVCEQLRTPLADAPPASPIRIWCPPFVTDALSAVSAVFAVAIGLSIVVRAAHPLTAGLACVRRGTAETAPHEVDKVAEPPPLALMNKPLVPAAP